MREGERETHRESERQKDREKIESRIYSGRERELGERERARASMLY